MTRTPQIYKYERLEMYSVVWKRQHFNKKVINAHLTTTTTTTTNTHTHLFFYYKYILYIYTHIIHIHTDNYSVYK